MTTLNTTNTLGTGSREKSAFLAIPSSILNALYAWQDTGKIKIAGSPSFRDLSQTRGDGQIDYAMPVWMR